MNIRSDFDLLWVNLGLVGDKYDSDAHNSFGVLSLSSSESRSVDKIALSVHRASRFTRHDIGSQINPFQP